MNTEIIAIIDRSGSMFPLAHDTVGGFNGYVDNIEDPQSCRMTLVLFNTALDRVLSAAPLRSDMLTHDRYQPGGGTALLDAIGHTMQREGERIKREKWAEKVIVVVITDGMENSSREFTNDRVREMVRHAEEHGWSFVYLGANQDSFSVARHFGMANSATMDWAPTGQGLRAAYAHATVSTNSLKLDPQVSVNVKVSP